MSKRSWVNAKLFAELVESMKQMNEVARGERAASREFHLEPLSVKKRRPKFQSSRKRPVSIP